jgi:hypothetical protein
LTRTQAEIEKSLQEAQTSLRDTAEELTETQRALKDAEARAEDAVKAQRTLQQQLDAARGDVDTRAKTSSHTQVELEKSLKGTQRTLAETMEALTETQQALKAAEARWEVSEQQLAALRASFISNAAAPPPAPAAPAKAGTPPAPAPPAPSRAPAVPEPEYKGPARSAKRVAMPDNTEVQIDGIPGKLIDVSLTGAQILVPAALKPNRVIKLNIPRGEALISCKGKVMWARLDPGMKGGQLWYRGGILFTSSDEKALEAFIMSHS